MSKKVGTVVRLSVIIGSTRPGRVGPSIAQWFVEHARTYRGLDEVELIDLAELDLPLFDEPHHPSLRQYEHEHTRNWSKKIEAADALVFVVPEYNHSFNSATKNAIDFLFHEWRDKSVGFVSYGGVAAGTRAVQALRQVFVSLKAVPVLEAVNIPGIGNLVADGHFNPPDGLEIAANLMLGELVRRDAALTGLREA